MKPYYEAADVTLYHGDCRAVMAALADGSVDAVVTDLPYGARRPSAWRSATMRFAEIEGNDSVRVDWILPAANLLRDGGAFYSFCTWDTLEAWRSGLCDAGLRVRSCIVWDKVIHGLADMATCWAPRHELILFSAKGRHELLGKRPVDVICEQRVSAQERVHPYEKPVRLLRRMISASTPPGGTILGPFAGSGTTLLAARLEGIKAIGIEQSEEYCEIIVRRLEGRGGAKAEQTAGTSRELSLFD